MSSQQPDTVHSEPSYSKPTPQPPTSPFFISSLDKYLDDETRAFLSEYCKVPSGQQSSHIHRIRHEAWAKRTYPCIGLGLFLRPYIKHSPVYQEVVQILRNGGSLLDVGCFVGSDTRQLAYAGAPTENILGVDIVDFKELGYKLFNDQDRYQGLFVEADITKINDHGATLPQSLEAVKTSKANVIHISAVLHQWIYADQVSVAANIVSAVSEPGTIFVGHQIGHVEAQEMQMGPGRTFMHNQESWRKMWIEVSEKTGQKWEVEQVRFLEFEDLGWDPQDQKILKPGSKVLDWVVRRIQ